MDIIGLSGLITPSLDEMVHVAKEMTREGLRLCRLLIGGATTSKAHTAVKIAPAYEPCVVHVLDASRAVGVVGSLVSADSRSRVCPSRCGATTIAMRQAHQDRGRESRCLPFAQARANRSHDPIGRTSIFPCRRFTGVQDDPEQPLVELVPYIDWSPFFHTWELRGRYPTIFEDPTVGPEGQGTVRGCATSARRDHRGATADRQGSLWVLSRQSVGDDIELYHGCVADDGPDDVPHSPTAIGEAAGQPNLALADFVAPKASGRAGLCRSVCRDDRESGSMNSVSEFERDHDDYNSIMAKALGGSAGRSLRRISA